MRPRRRCCRGFCAALSIQHSLFLFSRSHLFPSLTNYLSLFASVSVTLLLCLLISLLLHINFFFLPFFFHRFISLFSFFFLSQPFIYPFHSALFAIIYNISLFFSLSLLFISVALIILLPSWRFRKSSLYTYCRTIDSAEFMFFEDLKNFCEIRKCKTFAICRDLTLRI